MLHSDRSHSVNYSVLSLPNGSVMVFGPWPKWESKQSEAFWSPLYMHVYIQARMKHPKNIVFLLLWKTSAQNPTVYSHIHLCLCLSATEMSGVLYIGENDCGKKENTASHLWLRPTSQLDVVSVLFCEDICLCLRTSAVTRLSDHVKLLFKISAIVRKRDTRTGECRSLDSW